MSVTITFPHREALGQFEDPPDASTVTMPADVVLVSADRSAVAAHFPAHNALARHTGPVGVWDAASGKLLWWQPKHAIPLPARQQILVFDNMMRMAPEGGIAHRLVRCSWPRMTVLDDLVFGLPHSGIADLVLSPSERRVLTWLNSGQGQMGYELFGLDGPLRRLGVGELFSLPAMYCPPVFSPNERLVACSPGTRPRFWIPAERDWPSDGDWPEDITDEEQLPSLGGIATFGTLVVHDIAANTKKTILLRYDLAAGWVPRDPWNSRWAYGAIGIQFRDDTTVRLRLPDDATVDVELPAVRHAVMLPTPSRRLPDDEGNDVPWSIGRYSGSLLAPAGILDGQLALDLNL